MPQIQGIKGDAVVIYCEPLTRLPLQGTSGQVTKKMGYHRIS
jgi:hypothetical protein